MSYDKNREFTQEELLQVRPEAIVGFFSELAYGTKTPAAEAKPTGCRSTTLLNHKKMISHFLPQRSQSWDSIWGERNPSRSDAVNAFIGVVKVHEVRRTGSKSQATRAFNMEEFIKLLQVSEAVLHNEFKCACFRALMTLQWQMIGRVDDMQKTKVSFAGVRACRVLFVSHSHSSVPFTRLSTTSLFYR